MKNDEKQGFLRFFARKSTNFTYLFIKKWTSRWKCESCEVTISRQEACAPLSMEHRSIQRKMGMLEKLTGYAGLGSYDIIELGGVMTKR